MMGLAIQQSYTIGIFSFKRAHSHTNRHKFFVGVVGVVAVVLEVVSRNSTISYLVYCVECFLIFVVVYL